MDKSTSLLGFLAELSLTTERIAETMKGCRFFLVGLLLKSSANPRLGSFARRASTIWQ